jgi:hypothetical protein
MTESDPDDSPEYFAAKKDWTEFWGRVHEGLEKGANDDPDVAVARTVQQFGLSTALEAVERHIDNLPSNFENRWKARRQARICEQEEAERQVRNPYGAGRKTKRSDLALLAAWLIVEKCMRSERLTVAGACRELAKPPLRREASQWPGLLLECDYTAPDLYSGSYYVKTPETLRDIYNDARARYRSGPENLRQHWRSLLEGFTR